MAALQVPYMRARALSIGPTSTGVCKLGPGAFVKVANQRYHNFDARSLKTTPIVCFPTPTQYFSLCKLRRHVPARLRKAKATVVSPRASGSKMDTVAGEEEEEVTLLDYGAGNVRSVRNAITLLGYKIRDVSTAEDIRAAKKLIFPGVGAFAAAMQVINERGLGDAIREYIAEDKPFLGICLGLQLLFDGSEEFGSVQGLGVVPGIVTRFDAAAGPVPHMGWNGLSMAKPEASILDGVNGRHVYFVHSYRAVPSEANKEWVQATSEYGGPFVAALKRGNVQAVQFHPEKSGEVGLDILRRFLGPLSQSQAAKDVEAAAERAAAAGGRRQASALAKRVIACLDVRANDKGDLVVTKGDQYDVREEEAQGGEVRNLGKPVELAGRYFREGADEVLRRTSENVFVPLTVGGGIRDFTDSQGKHYTSLEVAAEYFRSGADKISIGSEAVFAAEDFIRSGEKTGRTGIEQISYVYGNQAVVVSIDPRKMYVKDPSHVPHKTVKLSTPGREGRPIGAYEVAKAVEQLGAGEILLNCIDNDGQGEGYDMDLVNMVAGAVDIPVIASSGAGVPDHFAQVFGQTRAAAALAAGIFHRRQVSIEEVKEHIASSGVETRLA
eukprot:jgi/Mesen1/7834/ME000417S07142